MTEQTAQPDARPRLAVSRASQSRRFQSSTPSLRRKRNTRSEPKRSHEGNDRPSLAGNRDDIAGPPPAKKQKASISHYVPTSRKLPATETKVSLIAEEEDESTSDSALENPSVKRHSRKINSSQPPGQQNKQAERKETSIDRDKDDDTELDEKAYEAAFKRLQKERRRNGACVLDGDHVGRGANSELSSSQTNSSAS